MNCARDVQCHMHVHGLHIYNLTLANSITRPNDHPGHSYISTMRINVLFLLAAVVVVTGSASDDFNLKLPNFIEWQIWKKVLCICSTLVVISSILGYWCATDLNCLPCTFQ